MRRTKKVEEKFFEELRKVPVVQVACEKTGISRNSIYRWRREDKDFKKNMEKALEDGIAFVNDMSESQLLTLIKEKSFPAIRFWLQHKHSGYKNKLEITNSQDSEELTSSQEKIVKKALELAQVAQEQALTNIKKKEDYGSVK